LYPLIFDCPFENLEFKDTLLGTSERNNILDGEMAIDRVIDVTVKSLKCPLTFTIQERFRRPKYYKWQDVTITEWNNRSGLPSELYKITSGLFVYGYYDEIANKFLDAIVVPVPDLLLSIALEELNYTKSTNKKEQDFICITFRDLESRGLISFRLYQNEQIQAAMPI
jgi:hypothetical protein